MAVLGEDFEFTDSGLFCNKDKEVIPYEKLAAFSRFKNEYSISYQTQKGRIKKVKIEAPENSNQSIDEFLKEKFPDIKIVEKKAGIFKCIRPFLIIPLCYIFVFAICMSCIIFDIDHVRIPIILFPVFEFISYSTYTQDFVITGGLTLAAILLGIFSYKKDNTIYQYFFSEIR